MVSAHLTDSVDEGRKSQDDWRMQDDTEMDSRIAKLESIAEESLGRLTTLERDVAVIKATAATKADVAEAKAAIIMWVVGAVIIAQVLPALIRLIESHAL